MIKEQEVNEFIANVREQTKIYLNFSHIMQKAENDHYLQHFHGTLNQIFETEMKFLNSGNFKRTFGIKVFH